MKKIFSTLALAIFTAMAFTACSDDDNEWVDPNGEPLKVISNDTSFDAPASTGSIVVDTTDPVTVTSNDNGWVTTTVNGNTIEVAVEQNNELDGRVATLTIKAGSKKTDVSIVQAGAIFKIDLDHIYRTSNAAYTTSTTVTSNLPVTVSSPFDWIQPSYDAETSKITVKLTANTTKHMRQGYFEYACGTTTGQIPVIQCVFSTDIVGDTYQIYFSSDDKRYRAPAAISGTASDCKIEIPALGLEIPATFNASTYTLNIKGGSQVGTMNYQNKDYILGLVMWDTESGYITWGTTAGLNGVVQNGFISSGDQVTMINFDDDGGWGTHSATSFIVELFSGFPFTSTNRAKLTYQDFGIPQLIRVDVPAASSSSTNSVKSMKMDAMTATPVYDPVVKAANANLKVAF